MGLSGTQCIHLICPENDVPASVGGIQLLQSIQADINRNQMVCCYGKLPDVFFNQQIQCLRLDGHVKEVWPAAGVMGTVTPIPFSVVPFFFASCLALSMADWTELLSTAAFAVFIRLYGFSFTGDRGFRLVGVIIASGTVRTAGG
ncbi:hypothetical protein [Clostridium sp.]|uniref:hypothetical protein n=1 Tax=Clostridium sp. TaxID=1506 RepID=UPI00258D4984|nr:hypothetical protein [Clostridium sp.]